eukprot:3253992-Pyramimonas_sp.AAC.1
MLKGPSEPMLTTAKPTIRRRKSLELLPPEAPPHRMTGCAAAPCPGKHGARPLLRPVMTHCSLAAGAPTCILHPGVNPRWQTSASISLC